MSKQPVLIPGPDHPITIAPAHGRVRVRFAERQIVDTSRALVLTEAEYPPVLYIPLEDVEPEVLRPSAAHTYCPYKGQASYYTLREGDQIAEDTAWSYVRPHEAVQQIAGHLAFYPHHVAVERDPD